MKSQVVINPNTAKINKPLTIISGLDDFFGFIRGNSFTAVEGAFSSGGTRVVSPFSVTGSTKLSEVFG